MKKILSFLCVAFMFNIFVCAESAEEVLSVDIYSLSNEILDSSPIQSKDQSIEEKADSVFSYFNFENFAKKAGQELKKLYLPSLEKFFGLLTLVLFSAVMQNVKINFASSGTITEYISILCISGYTFTVIKTVFQNIENFLSALNNTMLAIMPSMLTVFAAESGGTKAAVGYNGLIISLNAVNGISSMILSPAAKVVFALALVTAVSGDYINMNGLSSTIKNVSIKICVFCMSAIVAVMYFQNTVATAADSLASRTLRFGCASFIPVVGGLVSESVKTLSESVSLINTITGVIGISALISILLPPFIAIILCKISINLAAAFSNMLGCRKESGFLNDTVFVLDILNCTVIIPSITFIIIIAIFISSAA